jgi:hypothetical protein
MRWHSGAGVVLTLFCCHSALGAEQASQRAAKYSAEVAVGGEYDSNVAVDELDASSNQSDYAATLDAEIAMTKPLSESTEMGLSYDFSQNLYNDFDEVNRQTHIFGANLDRAFPAFDTGFSLFYISSLLDGDGFLSLVRASPSVSGFLGKKWFGRGAYVYSDKTLDQSPERDATTHAGEADLYFFRRGLRSYFNLGYRYRAEDASADHYDYHSNSIKLRYIHRFELPERTIKLELAWRYEDRDYLSETPSIGEKRADRRQRWQVDVELPLSQRSALQAYTGYGDYSSNYDPSDYDQLVTGTRLIYRW